MCHMWKMSHLSHVSHVIQCDSFCSWFIILNVIGLRFTTLAAFILLLGPHLPIRDLLRGARICPKREEEHVCQRQVRTNQSIIMEGCLVARTCASAHFWFRYHFRLKRFILQRGVHSNIIPESELSTIQNCSLEHLWNSHCPIDI